MKIRLFQGLFYAAFGGIWVPLGVMFLTFLALMMVVGLSAVDALNLLPPSPLARPIDLANVPFMRWGNSSTPFWAVPLLGTFVFALGGFFMRGDENHGFDDIHRFRFFIRQVFVSMAFGALFFGAWGAILAGIFVAAPSDGFPSFAQGFLIGTFCGEFIGLWIGAACGALLRIRVASKH